MKNNSTLPVTLYPMLRRTFRCYWSGGLLLTMIALLWMRTSLVYASPQQQTVPPPTPTQEISQVPTATPFPDEDNNDDNNNDNNAPLTNTPVPQPTAAPGLTGLVTVARLNVRQGPGTNFAPIGTVSSGETVTVLSRNPTGDWWRVCCVTGTDQEGWVAAQFIQPNFDLGQATTLIPVDGALPEQPPTPTLTPTLDPSVVPTTTTPTSAGQLALQIQQAPLYTWQGQTITLTYQIQNRGAVAATALELRNELPAELTLVGTPSIATGEFMTETTDVGRTVLVVRWPDLPAGSTVEVGVSVQVSAQMANGAVLDNLAVVIADGFPPVTVGLSIGMPPVTLPDFR